MDLRIVITRILAGSLVFGAGVACKCPPTAPDALVEGDIALETLAGEAADLRESDNCELVCDTVDELVDGWRCTFVPVVVPTSAECLRPGETEPTVVELVAQGLSVPTLELPPADCEAICMNTDGWEVAEQAGVPESSIWCTDLAGETLDALTMTCRFGSECIGGRRPLGACGVADAVEHAGDWWAAMAALEHVSVVAFEELARDLALHGAPEALVARARAAADDERRHTALCVARARAWGVEPALPAVGAAPPADLASLARHNAREGCVREAYAALEAGWQAQRAVDPADRAVLARIHADEVEHGQLAWDLRAWLADRVDTRDVIEAAFAELADEAARGRPMPALGLPGASERVALVAALRAAA